MNTRSSSAAIVIALSGIILGACDWVDSTGNQSVPAPVPPSVTDVFLGDTPVGNAISINEMTTARITSTRQTASGLAQTFTWSQEPLEQGNLAACDGQEGFNRELAAGSLLEACKSAVECQLDFQISESNSSAELAQFIIEVPVLDASVGLRHELTVEDSAGNITSTEYDFCLIAVNEAPIAEDDTFVATEGTVLRVTPLTKNLLTNDSDDTDVSNTEFAIVPEALSGPEFATFFELGTDGSFTYLSSLTDLREDQLDTFAYQLSDGLFTSTAQVTIRVVASNQAPQQLRPIPVLEATEDQLFTNDLSTFFNDPESGELSFSLAPATPLAIASGLELSTDGVLSGIPDAVDVGSYALQLVVSDGGSELVADVVLEVSAAPVAVSNSDPVFILPRVSNQTITVNTPMTPITARFSDEDLDVLTYTMAGSRTLPFGITLNASTGVLSGTPRISGVFSALRIRATDPSGGSDVSNAFTLTVLGVR